MNLFLMDAAVEVMNQTINGKVSEALQLLLIGMVAVFAALVLVIYIGKLIINMANRIPVAETLSAQSTKTRQEINPKVMAAITTAVGIITGGRGHITKIEKK